MRGMTATRPCRPTVSSTPLLVTTLRVVRAAGNSTSQFVYVALLLLRVVRIIWSCRGPHCKRTSNQFTNPRIEI
ncbi:hypothetical protein BC826DRAFT_1045276 [Russula brevipes]|nr:hypothetical protein BC826DRAFT_1045276 [Russula brevipes]